MESTADKTDRELLDYAWRHFKIIADQRLQTFSFYIILLAASGGGTLTVYERINKFWLIIACGVMHVTFSIVFFLIDQRSWRLARIPKDVLSEIEEANGWRLFRRDADEMSSRWNRIMSYTTAFRLAFFCQ